MTIRSRPSYYHTIDPGLVTMIVYPGLDTMIVYPGLDTITFIFSSYLLHTFKTNFMKDIHSLQFTGVHTNETSK